MTIPNRSPFVIVGAGIHGLSTAYHLALELKARGKGTGADVLVVDKGDVGAGASGIACGVIRNNYFQPAMRELIAHSVEIWESDPEAYSYHAVGYLQISPEVMHEDVASIAAQQREIGYESVFVEGAAASERYMKGLFSDWQGQGTTSVLHEKRGGYANNTRSLAGLASKARTEGVRVLTGVQVTGFGLNGGSVTSVLTDRGAIETDYVVIGCGPWARSFWSMLDLPAEVRLKKPDGSTTEVPMWHYMGLQEGTLGVDPGLQKTNAGDAPPVVHFDCDAPLYSDVDNSLITDRLWGIYYKPDFHFMGIQGGAAPFDVPGDAAGVNVDPYGPASPEFVVGEEFSHMWCSALAHCQGRFKGQSGRYKKEPSGGIGAFTPDSFPVFDVFRQNCYLIADSNHGYKLIGVGQLVAREILGDRSALLQPFRFARYEQGALHPVSHSPFPWS